SLTAPDVALDGARYPPLERLLATSGRHYAPISIALEGMAVVTGPNMGGKTAALRTLGFSAACAALGVPVPARTARLPLFDEIVWLGIGAADVAPARAGLLSPFGAELVQLPAVLGAGPAPRAAGGESRRALVLVDEFAQSTAPREGRALTIALLETLRERGALGLAATHFAGIAAAAGVVHFAIGRLEPAAAPLAPSLASESLEAALERVANGMTYALERVAEDDAPNSGALALARALGLDATLLTRAERALRSSTSVEADVDGA
ncbi:MAG: hypothetical protein IAI49_14280, partial [Candidatus Eremiobacteraeota bacterium]|nr:hypothetical protein [Candidatus Eremiobacteraeota bacterium]